MGCGSVEIKTADLQNYWGNEEDFFNVLDADEKAKANRFKFPILRRNYILAHAILRFEIATYLHIEPSAISYLYGPFGKPSLILGSLNFNMSHSMNKVLYGFSFDVEVGVDIEYMNPSISINDLPLSVLTLSEKKHILALPIERQKESFYRLWTQKEAYFKAIGTGLQDLSVNVPCSSGWHFHEPFCTNEYISSVAYQGCLGKIRLVQPITKTKAAMSIERPPINTGM